MLLHRVLKKRMKRKFVRTSNSRRKFARGSSAKLEYEAIHPAKRSIVDTDTYAT